MASPSILIIGATGRTGVALIRAATTSRYKPTIHAFARSPSRLPDTAKTACTSVQKGDATSAQALSKAIRATKATHIIVTVGVSDSLSATDVREASALALISALRDTSTLATMHVAVVSALGAGGSHINFGAGAGAVIMWVLRHALRDHDRQERALVSAFSEHDPDCARLLIVRPTGLAEARGKKRGVLVLGDERSPTWKIDRDVLANWLVQRICAGEVSFGGVVSLTGKPR